MSALAPPSARRRGAAGGGGEKAANIGMGARTSVSLVQTAGSATMSVGKIATPELLFTIKSPALQHGQLSELPGLQLQPGGGGGDGGEERQLSCSERLAGYDPQLWWITLCVLVVSFGNQITKAVEYNYIQDFSNDAVDRTTMFMLVKFSENIVRGVASVIAGVLADRWGIKRTLVVLCAGFTVAEFIIGCAGFLEKGSAAASGFITAAFVFQALFSTYMGIFLTLVCYCATTDRHIMMSILWGGYYLGYFFGLPAGPLLDRLVIPQIVNKEIAGLKLTNMVVSGFLFYVAGAICLIGTILTCVFVKDPLANGAEELGAEADRQEQPAAPATIPKLEEETGKVEVVTKPTERPPETDAASAASEADAGETIWGLVLILWTITIIINVGFEIQAKYYNNMVGDTFFEGYDVKKVGADGTEEVNATRKLQELTQALQLCLSGALSAIAQLGLIPLITSELIWSIVATGMFIVGNGFAWITAPGWDMIVLSTLVREVHAVGYCIVKSLTGSMVSKVYNSNTQGLAMGLFEGFRFVAKALAPVVGWLLYQSSKEKDGQQLPFQKWTESIHMDKGRLTFFGSSVFGLISLGLLVLIALYYPAIRRGEFGSDETDPEKENKGGDERAKWCRSDSLRQSIQEELNAVGDPPKTSESEDTEEESAVAPDHESVDSALVGAVSLLHRPSSAGEKEFTNRVTSHELLTV